MTVHIWSARRKGGPTANSILQEKKEKSAGNINSIQSYRCQRLDQRLKGVRGDRGENARRLVKEEEKGWKGMEKTPDISLMLARWPPTTNRLASHAPQRKEGEKRKENPRMQNEMKRKKS